MARREQHGARGGLLAVLFAAIAVLMQVNAPIARAATAGWPLNAICHDASVGKGERRAPPSPTADHCAACVACCTMPASALPGEGSVLPGPTVAVRVARRPEAFAHPVRGPPSRAPVARGPPPTLA